MLFQIFGIKVGAFVHSSHSNANGGSVFVKNGVCIQYRICSINSSIPADNAVWGCHSRVETTEENFIIDCSISKYSGFCGSLYLAGGNQAIEFTNISHGNCPYDSAYACETYTVSNNINFTSIIDNVCDKQAIIWHQDNSHTMYRCNIIKNIHNRKEDIRGILYFSGQQFDVSYCVFSLNVAPFLFDNRGTKFNVDHCFLDNNIVNTISSYSSVFLVTTNSLFLKLSHLSTQNCHADFPIKDKVNRFSFFDEYENQFCLSVFIPCTVS